MCFSYDDFFGAKKKIPSKRKSEVNDRSEDSDTGVEQEDSDIGDEQEDSDMGDEQDDDEAFENKVFFIYFYMLIEIN